VCQKKKVTDLEKIVFGAALIKKPKHEKKKSKQKNKVGD